MGVHREYQKPKVGWSARENSSLSTDKIDELDEGLGRGLGLPIAVLTKPLHT
jgi:hypothetical protein